MRLFWGSRAEAMEIVSVQQRHSTVDGISEW